MSAVALLSVAVTFAWSAGKDTDVSLPVEQNIAHALDNDAVHSPGRFVSATNSIGGDITVQFVLTDQGTAGANRAAAMTDALAIAHAIYQSHDPRVLNLTVLGVGSASSSYVPVLYASMPADQLVGRKWDRVGPEELSTMVGVRWLPTGTCHAWHECKNGQ